MARQRHAKAQAVTARRMPLRRWPRRCGSQHRSQATPPGSPTEPSGCAPVSLEAQPGEWAGLPERPAYHRSPMRPVARHLLPDTTAIDEGGRMSVGACDLVGLADRFGTPLFVYDEAHIRNRCRETVSAFGPGAAYASKAFLCRAMARLAHEEGMAIDVATGGEMAVALSAGVPADRLVFHGNNKSSEELAAGLDAGRLVIDSFDELDRLEK